MFKYYLNILLLMPKIEIPEDILYLVHVTSKKYKDDSNNLIWDKLNISIEDDQYPGCYFTLITKYNRLTEELFPGKYCLIFSRNLLKQLNYHINICDNNGFITEENTLFPWNLKKTVDKIKLNTNIPASKEKINYHLMNEVVFHDPISMKYLCLDIPINFFSNKFLPDYCINNKIKPDNSLLPYYYFTKQEKNSKYNCSINFLRKIAEVFSIDTNLSKDEIIDKIIEKSSYFKENRHLLNIN